MVAQDQLNVFADYMAYRIEAAVHRAVLAEREELAGMADRAAAVHGGEAAGALARLAADFRARGAR